MAGSLSLSPGGRQGQEHSGKCSPAFSAHILPWQDGNLSFSPHSSHWPRLGALRVAGQLALRLVSGLETSLPLLCVGTRRDPRGARARAELPRVGCPPGPLAEGPWGCLCATRVGSCGHGMAALLARPYHARVRIAALLPLRMEIWVQGARGGCTVGAAPCRAVLGAARVQASSPLPRQMQNPQRAQHLSGAIDRGHASLAAELAGRSMVVFLPSLHPAKGSCWFCNSS